ncbi:MAG: methyltransferase [Bacteroidia bacterium]|nr:methyltransferase [Bacteroidia bacterium]
MRKIFKRLISLFLVPIVRWYLRKERQYSYLGVNIKVFIGVFHPGLFYSTKFLINFILKQNIKNKSLLELGCGTGLLSIICARNAALVTATDLSQRCIENVTFNAKQNQASITIIQSDLFDSIDKQTFDWIIINPPYYARNPKDEAELAWHCGHEFEYFQKLFSTLRSYTNANSQVIMVLTLGCELDKIFAIAKSNQFDFELVQEKYVLFDGKDFLYRISPINSSVSIQH